MRNTVTMNTIVDATELALEEAVLGAAMLEKAAVRVVLGIVKSEDFFYKPSHQAVFKAINELFHAGKPVDILTVTVQLRENGDLEKVGGAHGVAQMTTRINSSANLEYHLHKLSELYTKRELWKLSKGISERALNPMIDPFDLLSEMSKGLAGTLDNMITKKPILMSQAYAEAIAKIQQGIGQNGLVGIPSGLPSIDKLTGGWRNSDLTIIAARPAMGKTAVALQYAKNAAVDYGKRVAFFSLEMSRLQLMYRLIAMESEFTNSQLSKSQLTVEDLEEVVIMTQSLQSNNLILDDTPGLTIVELRTKALKLKADHDIELIIVDYLQLMMGKGEGKDNSNREREIASISRGLKLVAKELDVPVIALSQLSRAVESRGDKKPQLSDLRESGSIEQDADTVCFLYRPEYYGIMQDEQGIPTAGTLHHIFAKHRNGPLDTIITRCDLAHNRISDYTVEEVPQPDW
jgi:replicative DNA helicase